MNKHRHMQYFVQIVDSGSISSAAKQLATSKSVVCQHLKDLESELGVTLINRSTRKQSVTTIGQQFYLRCKEIDEGVFNAWQEARDCQKLAIGKLRISAPNALIGEIIAPAIGDLVREHKGIVPILLDDDDRVNLIEHKIDLAIRVGNMPSSEYKQRKIGGFYDVLCASPEYLERHQNLANNIIRTRDLIQTIDYVANCWQGVNITHVLTHRGTHEKIKLSFKSNRQCNSLSAVVAMAKAGCGLAFIPDFIFNDYKELGELVEVFSEYECGFAPVYAVHAYTETTPTMVQLAIDSIKNRLNDQYKY